MPSEKTPHEIPVTQARAEFAELVNRVVYGGERIVVTRHGRPLIAMVSAEDLARLELLGPAAEPEASPNLGTVDDTPAHAPQPAPPRRQFGIAARHNPSGHA